MDRYGTAYGMWAQACEMLEQAERLQRQFFRPAGPAWEPPVDVYETERALWVVVALPGVPPEHVELSVSGRSLVVGGTRALPGILRAAAIRTMEIPSGRFERRITLPPGRYELVEQRFDDGCLSLALRKL